MTLHVAADAMQWVGFNFDEIADFIGEAAGLVRVDDCLMILSMNGEQVAYKGDWVVKYSDNQFGVVSRRMAGQ